MFDVSKTTPLPWLHPAIPSAKKPHCGLTDLWLPTSAPKGTGSLRSLWKVDEW